MTHNIGIKDTNVLYLNCILNGKREILKSFMAFYADGKDTPVPECWRPIRNKIHYNITPTEYPGQNMA